MRYLPIGEWRKEIGAKTRRSPFALLLSLLILSSCKSPFDRTKDASNAGALGTFNPNGSLVVFSNELQTGGGAFNYPSGDNQVLSFNDTSNSISKRSIRYSWNGGDVNSPGWCTPTEHSFAGFDLMHTPTLTTFDSTAGRNLTAAGYSKVTFYARGSLSANNVMKVEVASPGASPACVPAPSVPCITLSTNGTDADPGALNCLKGMLTSGWQQFTITGITSPNLSSIKDFFKATYVYNGAGTGSGGTVFFDQIVYAP